ncbi:MAG: IS200/IS605 family transposase [Micromonosporaceae bacterium]
MRRLRIELVEFNDENNHVHLLVNFPPKIAQSKLVNPLNGVSSRPTRQKLPDLVRHYHRANQLWSGSYFTGTVDWRTAKYRASVHQAAEPPV